MSCSRRSLLRQAGAAGLAASVARFLPEELPMTAYNKTLVPGGSVLVSNGTAQGNPETVTLAPDDMLNIVAGHPDTTPPPPPPIATNILGVDFAALPKTGAAWDRMKAAAGSLGAVTLTDTAGSKNGALLAAAFVAAATNDGTLKTKVVAVCKAALNGSHARTLEQARNLAPIAIALDAIGSVALDPELKRERDFKATDQGSVIDCHGVRPNNWGSVAGLARIAIDAHLKDTADLAKAVDIHKAWLGAGGHSFGWGDKSWQADTAHLVGINKKGATKSGQNIDGVLPEDQRRGGTFPSWTNQNYVWQALGEIAATQFILRASGYPDVFSWSDDAVKRAYALYAARGYGCTGDDGWQFGAAAIYGVTLTHTGFAPGKSFGFADWLYSA